MCSRKKKPFNPLNEIHEDRVSVDSSQSHPSTTEGIGWCARGDREPEEQRVPFNRPTVKQVYDALPFVRRYFLYWMKHTGKKEKLFINTFQPLQHKPHYGVPCGGIGSGSIGRDFRGGFCKFGLRPGLIEHKVDVVPADQFIVSVREAGSTLCVYQKVLCAADISRRSSTLSSWKFDFPKTNVYYRGLYPRSWTAFHIPELGLTLTLRQISPVIPKDYQDTALPVTVFSFDVENSSEKNWEVSVAFCFRNGTGNKKWDTEGVCSSDLFTASHDDHEIIGVTLSHTIERMPLTYGLATKSKKENVVTTCRRWFPSGSGTALWTALESTGDLPDEAELVPSSELGVGVCVRGIVTAGQRRSRLAEFCLVWDMPTVHFGGRSRAYRRRYTRQWGAKGDAAPNLCRYALQKYAEWEERIGEWQNPVLEHPSLPLWYKAALFNELYFMTDGGSLWFEWDDDWKAESQLSEYSQQLMRKYGRFGYLESWEYRMVNTYDVHFYASFALAQLWPGLEHTMQAEFTDQIDHSTIQEVIFHMEGDRAPLKSRSRVPHDLGNPAKDPWLLTNAYVMHDTGKWKDLNLKFVLTSYRDYFILLNRDPKFLAHTYKPVKDLMVEALREWDKDHDGMIENFGKADQTYDAWKMNGVSAYCGSLWLAALRVAQEMASDFGDEISRQLFAETLEKAKKVFEDKLWNGTYYRFCERSKSSETIMADQLCGYWFLQSVSPELADQILPAEHVRSALDTIFEFNVCRFAGGRMGAVNGMRPDGTVDRAYIQADEVWTGVTYAVGAFLIQQGEVQKGLDSAWGSYDACFNRFGLQFQTPEALYEKRFYRAIGYMRPLSIWAMQWALDRHCRIGTKDEIPQVATLRNCVHSHLTVRDSDSAYGSDRNGNTTDYNSEKEGDISAEEVDAPPVIFC